jgi:hypothetical protein
MQSHGRLISVRGERVAITGFLDESRERAVTRLRHAGASYQNKVNRETTIVVQGRPNLNYSYSDAGGEKYGEKLLAARQLRDDNHRIAIINADELDRLLRHKGLTRHETATAFKGTVSEFGLPHRFGRRGGTHSTVQLNLDLSALDRTTAEHHKVVDRLANALVERGLDPLNATEPRADLLWQNGRALWVAEIKTLNAKNQSQQLPLGLGQVLHYAATLRRLGRRNVRAALVVSRPCTDSDFAAAPKSARVALCTTSNLRPSGFDQPAGEGTSG